ncbi:MAG: hypothetical protein KQH63_09730 [Desulfobulbaceae bacterium]|nr:hypothetical protein [Desulfobulbaceae bacterium]
MMKKNQSLLWAALCVVFWSIPVMAEEALKWELIETLPDGRGYNYSPSSIKTIEGSIREVYDGVASPGKIDARQIRIDCAQKKWAIGETKSWRDGELVASPNFSEGGWFWLPIGNSLNEKLVAVVCREEK